MEDHFCQPGKQVGDIDAIQIFTNCVLWRIQCSCTLSRMEMRCTILVKCTLSHGGTETSCTMCTLSNGDKIYSGSVHNLKYWNKVYSVHSLKYKWKWKWRWVVQIEDDTYEYEQFILSISILFHLPLTSVTSIPFYPPSLPMNCAAEPWRLRRTTVHLQRKGETAFLPRPPP